MKNKFLSILCLFSLLFVVFLYASCDKETQNVDSGELTPNISGSTWQIAKVDFLPVSTALPDSSISNLGNITFNANGSGNTNASLIPGIDIDNLTTSSFAWQSAGSNVTLTLNDGKITLKLNASQNTSVKQVWRLNSASSTDIITNTALQATLLAYGIEYTFVK